MTSDSNTSGILGNSASNLAVDNSFSLDSEVAKQFIKEKSDVAEILEMMAYNQTYLELLDQLVVKVDLAILQNRNAQLFINGKLTNLCNYSNTNNRRQQNMTIPCWPPYFKDSSGMVPAQNQESLELSRICFNDPLMEEERKWKDKELDLLTEAVARSLKEQQTIQLEAKKQIIAAKLRNAGIETTDEQMNSFRAEVERIKHRIKYIRERPIQEIIREAKGDFSRVDWAKISATEFQGTRSINQLRQKWCNDLVFNRTPWTEEEDERLFDLAKDDLNWNVIAQLLNTDRGPFQCFERYLYIKESQKTPKLWTPEEDQKLRHYVQLLKIGEEIPWAKISMYMQGRSKTACEYRYSRSLNESLRHGRWTKAEDMLLLSAVNKYGPQNWNKIAENVNGRSALQCRDRWIHVLDYKRRDVPWGWEEHQRLLYGVRLFGRDECAKIAKLIPGRNNMDVRMRIRLLIKYKIEEAEKTKSKVVFRHFANNYIFCKMRRKSVIEEFEKYVETEQGDHKSQIITRLGLGEYVACPESGLGIDYTNVKKERSQLFGQWKIMGSGRWVKVLQKNPNEYDRDDLMSELDKLPEHIRIEAIEWIRGSDERLELERLQEKEIPDNPLEAKQFYEQIYPKQRLTELSDQVGNLLTPRERDFDFYNRYKKRPPKIRLKKEKKISKILKKKGKRRRKPKLSKVLLQPIEKIDLQALKWSDRILLEVNNYLSGLPKDERREYLIRSLCNSVRYRIHHANLLMFRTSSECKNNSFRMMSQYAAEILNDPPAPIPIKPAIREERENAVVLPSNWQSLSLKEMMQYRISPIIYPALAQQAQRQQDKSGEGGANPAELPLWRKRKRRRYLAEKSVQGFKDTVICPMPRDIMDEQKYRHNSALQTIMRKMLPPCPGTVNAAEFFETKARKQLLRGTMLLNDGGAVGSSGHDEEQHLHPVPELVRQSVEYALLKKRIYRMFFLPLVMQKAILNSRDE